MNRILILTADAGFGHRSAAIAIQEALRIKYPEDVYSEIINPLENKLAPAILRDSQTDYDKWVREVPELVSIWVPSKRRNCYKHNYGKNLNSPFI